jgi:hypothetical protein
VLVGAFAYECNVFSGMEAVTRMLTGEDWVVALVQVANALLVTALSLTGSTESVSLGLSSVVVLMIALILTTVAIAGVPAQLWSGLLPSFPESSNGADDSTEVALGVIGTTATPLGLLMASAIARGAEMSAMREGAKARPLPATQCASRHLLCSAAGVGVASVMCGVVSALVLLSGTALHGDVESFSLARLAGVFEDQMGPAGRWIFATGVSWPARVELAIS